MKAMTRPHGFITYLLVLGQTLGTAQRLPAVGRLQSEPRAAAGATVLTDAHVVHVAEAMETRITADLVNGLVLNNLMFALRSDSQRLF